VLCRLGAGRLGLQQCTTYYYAIKWKDGIEESPMSNVVTSMTLCQGFIEVECP
jgi:hypothetical protein